VRRQRQMCIRDSLITCDNPEACRRTVSCETRRKLTVTLHLSSFWQICHMAGRCRALLSCKQKTVPGER
ncbi:hypothetical protein ACX3VG_24315, partial [Escherichia coli]